MKALFPVSLLFVCLFGCKSASVDKDDLLHYKETMLINEVPRTTLTFFDVTDSRCPINADCIWAGNATVDLALTGVTAEGTVIKHINMCMGTCSKKTYGPDTLDYEFTGQKYRFILREVNSNSSVDAEQVKSGYTIALDAITQTTH